MLAHSTLLVTALGLVSLGFGGALLDGSPEIALAALLGGWIFVALIATAWIRPASGSREHHPKVDRWFDDMAP
jgi:hypothetical protein